MSRTRRETAEYKGDHIVLWGTAEDRKSFPKCRPPSDEPQDYMQWHTWARNKSKSHRQVRCREHGLFHNWVKKRRREA